ncbi:hypothetical protein [Campylobacter pinnipediorum]|uniref:hypothetical protein n=1 Tax=Campylobacter pinnipediorum TaxID=1965231 RepID=UPI0015D6621D|nr:hypothetical protein [Campylobacter pinnipediorum]
MDKITNKERRELESVFACICSKKESRFVCFYREFYAFTTYRLKRIKVRFRSKKC